MNRIFQLVACLLFSVAVFSQQPINDANVQVRDAKNFHAIHIGSAFKVILTKGTEEKVAVSAAEQKDLEGIIVEVKNGVLYVGWDRKIRWSMGNKKLRAYISFTDLNELNVSGASNVDIQGTITTPGNFKLDLSGASDVKGVIEVGKRLIADLSGASDATISGKASEIKVGASGASKFRGYDFIVEFCDADASGASDIRLTVNQELTAEASGASAVKYKGDAKEKDVRKSGASSVSRS